jgi:ribonuclease BN (tRNA processing enzyme)
MVSADVGRLAARVQPEELVLFHVSDRYGEEEWQEQLAEVGRQFDRVVFPKQWQLSNREKGPPTHDSS